MNKVLLHGQRIFHLNRDVTRVYMKWLCRAIRGLFNVSRLTAHGTSVNKVSSKDPVIFISFLECLGKEQPLPTVHFQALIRPRWGFNPRSPTHSTKWATKVFTMTFYHIFSYLFVLKLFFQFKNICTYFILNIWFFYHILYHAFNSSVLSLKVS